MKIERSLQLLCNTIAAIMPRGAVILGLIKSRLKTVFVFEDCIWLDIKPAYALIL